MEKVVNILSLKERQTDFNYWQTKNFKDRLEAIELLRLQFIKYKKDVQPRLQRVCRIIK